MRKILLSPPFWPACPVRRTRTPSCNLPFRGSAVVTSAVSELRLTFTEPLEAAFSTVALSHSGGTPVSHAEGAGRSERSESAGGETAGAVAAGALQGGMARSVGRHAPHPRQLPIHCRTLTTVQDALIACQWLHFASAMLLFGGGVMRGTLRRNGYGWNAQLDVRLFRLLVPAAVIALLTAVGWLLLEAASMGDQWSDAMRPRTVLTVLTATAFGQLWLGRLPLAALICLLAWLRKVPRLR